MSGWVTRVDMLESTTGETVKTFSDGIEEMEFSLMNFLDILKGVNKPNCVIKQSLTPFSLANHPALFCKLESMASEDVDTYLVYKKSDLARVNLDNSFTRKEQDWVTRDMYPITETYKEYIDSANVEALLADILKSPGDLVLFWYVAA